MKNHLAEKQFADGMKDAASEYYKLEEQEKKEAQRRERNQRACRQFTLFVIFLAIAAGMLYREEVLAFVNKFQGDTATLADKDPRVRARKQAEAKINVVANEAERRNKLMDKMQSK